MGFTDLDQQQRSRTIELVESMAWGDMDAYIGGVEKALVKAMEATVDGFLRWEAEGKERFGDEFSLEPDEVAALSPEWRLAYVGRLLRSLAHDYGAATEFDASGLRGEHDPHSPLGLLRGLNEIVHLRSTATSEDLVGGTRNDRTQGIPRKPRHPGANSAWGPALSPFDERWVPTTKPESRVPRKTTSDFKNERELSELLIDKRIESLREKVVGVSAHDAFLEPGLDRFLEKLPARIDWWRQRQIEATRPGTIGWGWFQSYIDSLSSLLARQDGLAALDFRERVQTVAVGICGRTEPVEWPVSEKWTREKEDLIQEIVAGETQLARLIAVDTWGADAFLPLQNPTAPTGPSFNRRSFFDGRA